MSLSKRLCKRSSTEVRQSFSERICDDLCEVILQYLPLKDKIKLESVSKQFQWTLFRRQYELTINLHESEGCDRLFKNSSFDLKSLESLLKKCPNITSIELIGFFSRNMNHNYNEFIVLITKYCNNLLELKSPFEGITVSAYEEFHNKFGSKLKAIKPSICLKTFPNLEELDLSYAFNSQQWPISKLKFEKLIKLVGIEMVGSPVAQDMVIHELLENSPSLRYLEVHIYCLEPPVVNPLLKDISKLKDLIHLKVESPMGFLFDPLFSNLFKDIANNCPKLKSFGFDLDFNNLKEKFELIPLKQLLSPLKHFRQLKRLVVTVSDPEELLVKDFEDLSNLTHLTFSFYYTFELRANVFTNIENILPNLQYLELINIYEEPESSQIADILSPLLKLKTIKIKSPSQSFCQTIEEKITKKCPQINNIYIKYDNSLDLLGEIEESDESEEYEGPYFN